jgi:hypothetical protein
MSAATSDQRRVSRLPRYHLQDLALNALPGLLAGAHAAGLLFFLNPDLKFGWLPLARAGALSGLIGALVSGLALSAHTWRKPGSARRLLPWTTTTVLASSAALAWTQASYLVYFLHPGIKERLIKAAVGLTVAALVCFYTSLLHTFPPKAYGRRSFALFLALALLSVYLLGERRGAFRPRDPAAPLPSTVSVEPRSSLFVVGLPGATLDAILPLAEQGQLPFFTRLVEEGAHGRLQTLRPTVPAALWASLATGRLPYRHGVLGRWVYEARWLFSDESPMRLLPVAPFWDRHVLPGVSRRPFDSGLRRNPALWEILDRLGVASGVVDWPATRPVRSHSAFLFSDHYFSGDFSALSARPPELAERGVLFQVASDELDPDALAALGDRPPAAVLEALAGDTWRQSLTLFLLDQRRETRALFLMLPGLSEVSRLTLGGFTAHELGGRRQDSNRQAAQILTAYYQQLDLFLAQLWQRAPQGAILAVVSPYGVEPASGWRLLRNVVTGRSTEGSLHPTSDGVIFLLGSAVRGNQFLNDAGILDVMPTLLYSAGCPIGRDLDGRVLVSAFTNDFLAQAPLTFVPSYETLAPQGAGRP